MSTPVLVYPGPTSEPIWATRFDIVDIPTLKAVDTTVLPVGSVFQFVTGNEVVVVQLRTGAADIADNTQVQPNADLTKHWQITTDDLIVLGQEVVKVDPNSRNVLNVGAVNFASNQLEVAGVVVAGGGGGGGGGGSGSGAIASGAIALGLGASSVSLSFANVGSTIGTAYRVECSFETPDATPVGFQWIVDAGSKTQSGCNINFSPDTPTGNYTMRWAIFPP